MNGTIQNLNIFAKNVKTYSYNTGSNVRDYATINELTVLSNLETHNAQMIREGKGKEERFVILKEIASYQMNILSEAGRIFAFEEKDEWDE